MKKFTLTSGGSVWIDLKEITVAITSRFKEKPEVFVYAGNFCHAVSTGDINAEVFAENLAAEIDAAKNGVTVETKPFDGAPLPDKDGLIYTDKKFSFPLAHLDALYIKNGYEVRAIFKGVDDVIFRFETQHRDTPANSLDYLTKLVSYTTLTKVDDRLYVDKDAVKDVIVERNDNNWFDVKIVIGINKFIVDCEFEAVDAFDAADDAKSKLKNEQKKFAID